MHYLVNGIVATGADVFHPGQTPTPSEDGQRSDTGVNGPDNPGAISATTSTTILNDSVADEIMDEDSEPITVSSRLHEFIQFTLFLNRQLPQHLFHQSLANESVLTQNL
jgi:hypothetical protein